ncbi:hypothetical protein JCM10908_005735 [Rhodotorula pacifica]|uniref:uncharacterized protein n=1 Tax=Rhodotorula pacifica TaxID=1495444 RepID=UPI00318180F7
MYGYYNHQQQPQPLQTLPSSPLNQPHLLAASSSSPTTSSLYSHPGGHSVPVPFGLVPGSQPGVLGWGVGMSAANGAGFGFGSTGAQSSSSSHRAQASTTTITPGNNAVANTSAVGWGAASRPASPSSPAPNHHAPTPSSNARRRRRSPSPDHGAGSGDDEHMSVRKIRPMYSASSKRARVQPTAVDTLGGGSHSPAAVVGDLGKALASLDKPALLDVFSRLLSTQPALAPLISTLLPAPSLSTVLSTLSTLERNITAATPTGAFVRSEYVWSRVRVPVEEFVTESRRFIALFVPAQAPPVGHTVTEEDLSHPSTCFEFLEALTRALLRLESALPATPPSASSSGSASSNPLATHLMPLTLNAWHTFLTRLSTAVQSHGKVLPNSLVQAWFDRLDLLAAESVRDRVLLGGGGGGAGSSASAVRRAMEGVRDRAKKELGWLVGIKNVDGALSAGMEGVEQEEEL